MKILIAGDAHGDRSYISHLFKVAKEFDADKIFQLGDFGYWPKDFCGGKFLAYVSGQATRTGIPFYWLDGNHEDHTHLTQRKRDGFIEHERNLFYSPRGHQWEWDGVKFLSVGGSYSIPTKYRIRNNTWFEEEELISDDDVEAAISHGQSDVLLSHDVPHRADILGQYYIRTGVQLRRLTECDKMTAQLEKVCEAVKPRWVYHGHYHMNYKYYHRPTHCFIHGLGDNSDPQAAWTIFDTERTPIL